MMELDLVVKLFLYLIIHVASSQTIKDVNIHHLDAALHHYDTLRVDDINHTSPADAHHVVKFSALGRDFHLVLEWDRNLLAKDFALYSVDAQGRHHAHSIQHKAFLHGRLHGQENSIVTAHLADDGILSAVIATPTDTYHVEPSQHYISQPHPFHMVAYAKSHVKQRLNSTLFDYATPPMGLSKHHTHSRGEGSEPVRRLRRQTLNVGAIREESCNMVLIADTTAFQMFGSSVSSTSSQLVLLVSTLDKLIFRPTKWLIDVDDNVVEGLGHSIGRIIVRTQTTTDPSDYNFNQADAGAVLGLMRLVDWSAFCLAHLFTNKQLLGGLLGLANIASPSTDQTGGICSRSFPDFSVSPSRRIIFNTGLSTYNNAGQRMVLSEMVRVTGHELGHNWGSHHDPNTEECSSFIMNEFAQDGSALTHTMFSNCSRRSVGNVLLSKAGCFVSALCGDFIVDEGEDCDAGAEGDVCCTSQCTLTRQSQCSDVNSPCCVGCRAANSSVQCRAPISIDCVDQTLCDGEGFACPESPPIAENTTCPGGVCQMRDSASTPNCVPLCESMDLMPCMCESAENECMVCCMTGGVCTPRDTRRSNGSPCSGGVCRNGECTDRVQDTIERFWSIITNLDSSAFLEFVVENIVGWTLIFSIPAWCIGSCTLHWLVDFPRQKRFEESVEKVDMAKLFVSRRQRQRPRRMEPSEKRELLEGTESPEENDEPVDEPVDDLPPPKL